MTKLSQITLQSLIHTQFNKAPGSKRESTVCCSTGSSVYLVVSIWREQVLQLLDYRAAFDTRGPFNSFTSSPFWFHLFLIWNSEHLPERKNVTNNIVALHLRERAIEPVGWAFVTRTNQAGIMTAVVVTSLQTNLLAVKCLKNLCKMFVTFTKVFMSPHI